MLTPEYKFSINFSFLKNYIPELKNISNAVTHFFSEDTSATTRESNKILDPYFAAQVVHIPTLGSFGLSAGFIYALDYSLPVVFFTSFTVYLSVKSLAMYTIQNYYTNPN